ncbi:PLP-dependent aminotransferase family protein [Salipiger mucosus]|uniref:Transcriptional regulator, GntR family domain protein / Aspartate aminotransferase n=1 Tax=Salipiger mucosus DSM 16094 TaxID=1123237 RepID=S9Q8W2_9RHOB|nr:PLP-dependent aminotransferase family protein [Salipiger mucosus]EPX76447.1 Transcriptional regulator, GntR family domain protein / Aspartate aminotransferase [Salipiger mucosus DSM 16094]
MPRTQFIDLADRVAAQIADGTLPPGAKLPPHRAFAERHGVALATATRAYRELERRNLIVGERGRGMFVRDASVPAGVGVEQAASDGLIDLVFNMPGSAADADMLRAGLKRLAAGGDLDAMLRYQPHDGRPHERKVLADWASARLGPVAPETLLVTSGAQHALSLIMLGLFGPGDAVGTDPLTYAGIKSVAALRGTSLVPVEGDAGVMDPDALDHACRSHGLRAVYLMPTVQNPLGAVMNEATRRRIVEVTRRRDLLIIEDSAYAFLETDPPPSLRELAPERTIHVGGVSKSLGTGLRVGFLIAPETQLGRLTGAIRATTWNTPALITALVTAWIEDGTLGASEDTRRRDGAERQRLCRETLADLALVAHRNAGFAWMPLPTGRRADPLVARLRECGVAVSPGAPYAVGDPPQAIRLAFGGVPLSDLTAALTTIRRELTHAQETLP